MDPFDITHWSRQYLQGRIARAQVERPLWTDAYFTEYDKDGKRTFVFNDKTGWVPRQERPLPFDLSEGLEPEFEDAVAESARNRAKQNELELESRMAEPIRILKALAEADVDIETFSFVCPRKCFVVLATTSILPTKAWRLDACCLSSIPEAILIEYGGTGDTIVDGKVKDNAFEDSDRFSFYGERFEALFRKEMPVNEEGEAKAFSFVVRTVINDLHCALQAKVSCYDPEVPVIENEPDLASFIQLRSRKLPMHDGQHFRAKMSKYPQWWIQSYLIGVPRIDIGNWTPYGFIERVETFLTEELPHKAQQGIRGKARRELWTPEMMIDLLHSLLKWMQNILQTDRDVVYRFLYNPETKCVTAESLNEDVSTLLDD